MRDFDVILMGASGFTGQLVAEYFLKTYPSSDQLKWAMAGRNQSKLEEVRARLGDEEIPILIADSLDDDSLNEIVPRAKVICTTVGPYAIYGTQLVEACIRHNTHYCDLTGEVQWMRKTIDLFHDKAKSNQTKIVHTCGFDSVPSDMGVYYMQSEILKKYGAYASHIKYRVRGAKGGMSGGTIASLNNVLKEAEKDKSIYKVLRDPYGLNPPEERSGPDRPDLSGVKYDSDIGSWLAPFIMAMINTKVVRRSNALASYPYGKDFRYDEAMMTGSGIPGRIKAYSILTALGALMGGRPGSLWKKLTQKFLPEPGEGPSKRQRENGFFNIALFAKINDGSWIRAKVTGDMDPGYGSTSKMLGEAAVSLALDGERLGDHFGVLTPATAMGETYLERLKTKAGLSFEMLSSA